MVNLWLILLPVIVLLGIITSYTDIKFGKIRNKEIVLFLVISAVIHFIFLLIGEITLAYIYQVVVSVLLALALGFVVWFFGMWSEGDAKLYVVFVALFPKAVIRLGGFDFISIFINIIIPVFLYLVIIMLIRTSVKQKIFSLKRILSPANIITLLIVIFSLTWISDFIFSILNLKPNYILYLILIYIIMHILERIVSFGWIKRFGVKIEHVLIGIAVLRVIFDRNITNLDFWVLFFGLTLSYAVIKLFIDNLGSIYSYPVKIENLKKGMIPSELINKKFEKVKAGGFSTSQMNLKQADYVYTTTNIGFTSNDLQLIKDLYGKGKLKFDSIKVHQTMPFAPLIWAGVLITFFIGGDLITFLFSII